jgi:hypothetical protein
MRNVSATLALTSALLAGVTVVVVQNPAAEKLTALIVRVQNKSVKKSTEVYAYNCFTEDDLAWLRKSGRMQKIVEGLKTDVQFTATVTAIRELPESTRVEVLAGVAKSPSPRMPWWGSSTHPENRKPRRAERRNSK